MKKNPFAKIDSITLKVKSSLITEMIWTKTSIRRPDPFGELIVSFKSNDSKYLYEKVPASIINEMVLSESAGKYFCKNIKDNYKTFECEE